MKRLKPGEYQAMTEEQKKEHRSKRFHEWISRPGNKEKVSAFNRDYQHRYWQQIKFTPFVRNCSRCGKTAVMYGRKTVCDDCRAKPTKKQLNDERHQNIQQRRQELESKVLFLASTTTMTQKEIGRELGIFQERVSIILRKNGIRRVQYKQRKKND